MALSILFAKKTAPRRPQADGGPDLCCGQVAFRPPPAHFATSLRDLPANTFLLRHISSWSLYLGGLGLTQPWKAGICLESLLSFADWGTLCFAAS